MENLPPTRMAENGVGLAAGTRTGELVSFLPCSGVLPGSDLLCRATLSRSTADSTSRNLLQKQWLNRLEDQRGV
jgi:hypothetical protein